MANSCGADFMRGVLLFFNGLFILIGLTLTGIGIYVKVDKNFSAIFSELVSLDTFDGQSIGYLAFALIGGGVFTLLIAIFGCIGALWKSRCSLFIYAIVLCLLMILELAGVIMAIVYKGKLQDVYEKPLYDALEKAIKKDDTNALDAFALLEDALECCGVHNISDYGAHPSYPKSKSCKGSAKSNGCSQAIINFLSKNFPMIAGVLGGVIALELFAVIGACVLSSAIKREGSYGGSYSSSPGFGYRSSH